jgi:hypothetical protein
MDKHSTPGSPGPQPAAEPWPWGDPAPWAGPPEQAPAATVTRQRTCDRCGATGTGAGPPPPSDEPWVPDGWLEANLTWGPPPFDRVAIVWLCPPCQEVLAGCMDLGKWTWDGEAAS